MTTDLSNWKTSTLRYVAWLVASAGVIMDAIFIREATLDILTLYQMQMIESMKKDPTANTSKAGFIVYGYDVWIMLGLAVLAVAFCVGIEYYFRYGEQKGRLAQRVVTVFGVEVLIIAVAYTVQFLI